MEEGYRFEGKDPYKKDPLVKEKILWGGGLAGVLLVTPTIFVLPLALIPAFLIDQKIAEINYINMNIKNRSFVDRTIYPGETQSGFIYFRVPGREPVSHIKCINLAVKELRSEKEQQFIFDFNK
jgi:hypothetical protein